MSFTQPHEEYQINTFEYGHVVEDESKSSKHFKVYMPKIMGFFPKGKPAHTNWIFNNNIFLNDAACKPLTKQQIQTQNYITLRKHLNRDFAEGGSGGMLTDTTRVIVHIMDKNIRDMRISDVL